MPKLNAINLCRDFSASLVYLLPQIFGIIGLSITENYVLFGFLAGKLEFWQL
jgi:hypothetical protein